MYEFLLCLRVGTFRADHGRIKGCQRASGGVGPELQRGPGSTTPIGNTKESPSTVVGGTERPAAKQVIPMINTYNTNNTTFFYWQYSLLLLRSTCVYFMLF